MCRQLSNTVFLGATVLYVGACVEGSLKEHVFGCVGDVQLALLLSPSTTVYNGTAPAGHVQAL